MQGFMLDPTKIRDISPDVLDDQGRLRVLPAAYWATTTREERMLFGHRHAAYGFPTVELIDYLREFIGGRKAIEIGSGDGVLADALGIQGTDSHQQSQPKYREAYDQLGAPVIRYGKDVAPFDAAQAVRRFKPDVVIASWVTHKYSRARHWAGGNEVGVDEHDVIARCREYVFIGNLHVHRVKAIWELPHQIAFPPFVYSRAMNGSPDFVAIWPGSRST